MSYGYITKLSENVDRQHVRYNNRYGTAIAADIYTPKNLEEDKLLPAIVIGAPYGSTKEQAAAIYANIFAQLGFVTLAFDQVYIGESAGESRHVASPDLYAESFSAAVDYLGTKLIVNKLALLVSVGALGLLLVLRLLIRELNLL